MHVLPGGRQHGHYIYSDTATAYPQFAQNGTHAIGTPDPSSMHCSFLTSTFQLMLVFRKVPS
jgi:hypothetical protein